MPILSIPAASTLTGSEQLPLFVAGQQATVIISQILNYAAGSPIGAGATNPPAGAPAVTTLVGTEQVAIFQGTGWSVATIDQIASWMKGTALPAFALAPGGATMSYPPVTSLKAPDTLVIMQGGGFTALVLSALPAAATPLPTLPALSAPLAAVYGMTKAVSTYSGPVFRLVRASDSATMDVTPLASGIPDYAAIDTWVGASTAAFDRYYDQSGNGYHATSNTAASRPSYSSDAVAISPGGIRGALFDIYPLLTAKIFTMPAITGLDVQNMGFHVSRLFRSPSQAEAQVSFANSGGTADLVVLQTTSGGNQLTYPGSSRSNSNMMSVGAGTMAAAISPTVVASWADGKKDFANIANASASIAFGGQIGRTTVAGGTNSNHTELCTIIFASTPADADIAALDTWSASAFGSRNASPAYNVVIGGTSIMVGYRQSLTKNPPYMAGLPASVRVVNGGLVGQNLYTNWQLRTSLEIRGKVTGIPNVWVMIDAVNDLGTAPILAFTSAADAQAWADATWSASGGTWSGGTIAATGGTTKVTASAYALLQYGLANYDGAVVPTMIARGGYDTTANWLETARLRWNANAAAAVAALASAKYQVADYGSQAHLGGGGPSDASNTTYFYSDTTHPTNAGGALMGPILRAALMASFAGLGYTPA